MVQHIHKTTFCQDIVWQKQFGVVGDTAKTLVDDRVVVAPGCNEDGKLLCHLGVVIKKFHESLAQFFLHLWDASLSGFIHDDRSACSISIRQNRTAEIVLLQDSDGAEAVESGVGSFLIHLADTFLLNTVIEGHPLVVEALSL